MNDQMSPNILYYLVNNTAVNREKTYALLFFLYFIWGYTGIILLNIDLPIIRQILGFIYLTFIPGILLISILKLKINSLSIFYVYTIGLSIFIVTMAGLLINQLYPIFGFHGPLTEINISIFLSFVLSIFILILFFSPDNVPKFPGTSSLIGRIGSLRGDITSVFLCILIPSLSIIGTYFVNNYKINLFLIIMILTIAVIPLIIGYTNAIPTNLYPTFVYSISIALLLHISLISNNIYGYDIQFEYNFLNMVLENRVWDPNMPHNLYSILSISILPAVYSLICGIESKWVFKCIWPLLFATVPLGMYWLFNTQIKNAKVSFLSVYLFIVNITFYVMMASQMRTQIAEIGLVLLLISLIDEKIENFQRVILCSIFSFIIITSHYSVNLLFQLTIIMAFVIAYFAERTKNFVSENPLLERLRGLVNAVKIPIDDSVDDINNNTILKKFKLLILYFVISYFWMMYISHSSLLKSQVTISQRVYEALWEVNIATTEGSRVATQSGLPLLQMINHNFHMVILFFVFIGALYVLIDQRFLAFKKLYIFFSFAFLLLNIFSLTIPTFSANLYATRIFQITFILLAPFCIIGGLFVANLFSVILTKVKIHHSINIDINLIIKIFSLLFCISALFNTGFVYEVFGNEIKSSIAISEIDAAVFNNQDVSSAKWLVFHKSQNFVIATDKYRCAVFSSMTSLQRQSSFEEFLSKDRYIYLGSKNIKTGQLLNVLNEDGIIMNFNIRESKITTNRARIYDNGLSKVYK